MGRLRRMAIVAAACLLYSGAATYSIEPVATPVNIWLSLSAAFSGLFGVNLACAAVDEWVEGK